MSPTVEDVRAVFGGPQSASGPPFFDHVADDVDWTVQGTHPLAGHYRGNAAFLAGTFAKLAKCCAMAPGFPSSISLSARLGGRRTALGRHRQERDAV